MRVGRERVPAHGVRARRQRAHGRHDVLARARARLPGVVAARLVEHLRRPAAATNWSKCRRIVFGDRSSRCWKPGETLTQRGVRPGRRRRAERQHDEAAARRLTGAAPPRAARGGRRSARRRGRSRASPRARSSRSRSPTGAPRERGRQTSPSGTSAPSRSVQPSRWCRNAERANSQSFCSWTRNARPGDRERDRRRELPPAAVQLAAREPELGRAHHHQRLRPRAVREHVDRRVRVEASSPATSRTPMREREPGPQVDAPGAAAPDLLAGERLGEPEQTEHQHAGREQPVDGLARGRHRPPPDRPGAAVATSSANRMPAPTTRSGGSISRNQRPCPRGWSSVIRSGCRIAQTMPAATHDRPDQPHRACTRAGRGRLGRQARDELCLYVHLPPPWDRSRRGDPKGLEGRRGQARSGGGRDSKASPKRRRGAPSADGRCGRAGSGAGAQDPDHARERRGGVVLDLGEPVADGGPAERDDDREHGEDGQRVGVQPRREHRPAPDRDRAGVALHEVPERGRRKGREPEPRRDREARPAGRPGRRWPSATSSRSPATAVESARMIRHASTASASAPSTFTPTSRKG